MSMTELSLGVADCLMQTEVVRSLSAKIVSSSEMIKLSQYILATALPYPLLIAFCIHIHVHDAASLTVL